MTEHSSSRHHAGDKRRTTRVMQAVPITVKGSDALGQPFKEPTCTVMVNCNGCKFQSKHYIPKDSIITIEIRPRKHNQKPRILRGRVIWVQRPRTVREVFHIGMEFDVPGNVWNVEAPPGDWFPHPEDEELVIPVYPHAGEPELVPTPAAARHTEKSEPLAELRAAPRAILASPAESASPADSAQILSLPVASQQLDSQFAVSRELMKAAAHDAVAEELARFRAQFDAQLQQAIEKNVNALIERVTEAAANNIAAQVAAREAASNGDSRQSSHPDDGDLVSKIRQAVEEAFAAQQENPYRTPSRRKRRPRF